MKKNDSSEDMRSYLSNFSEKTILITGSTGFIGRYLVETLHQFHVAQKGTVKVIAHGRSLEKLRGIFSEIKGESDGFLEFLVGDVTKPLEYEGKVDYIVHAASLTASEDFIKKPLETISTALDGTRQLLEFAEAKKVKKMVYLSSMEVYGLRNYDAEPVSEENYGYMDLLDVRNSYPQSKRMCETLCHCYQAEKGVSVVSARLTQVFGGEIEANDQRMFAQFMRSARNGEEILLKTAGTTVRGYCHIEDAAEGIFCLLLRGEDGQAYNICHPELTMSVREIAEKIADFYGTSVRIEEKNSENLGYLPPFRLVLSVDRMKKIGWTPKLDLLTSLRQMETEKGSE